MKKRLMGNATPNEREESQNPKNRHRLKDRIHQVPKYIDAGHAPGSIIRSIWDVGYAMSVHEGTLRTVRAGEVAALDEDQPWTYEKRQYDFTAGDALNTTFYSYSSDAEASLASKLVTSALENHAPDDQIWVDKMCLPRAPDLGTMPWDPNGDIGKGIRNWLDVIPLSSVSRWRYVGTDEGPVWNRLVHELNKRGWCDYKPEPGWVQALGDLTEVEIKDIKRLAEGVIRTSESIDGTYANEIGVELELDQASHQYCNLIIASCSKSAWQAERAWIWAETFAGVECTGMPCASTLLGLVGGLGQLVALNLLSDYNRNGEVAPIGTQIINGHSKLSTSMTNERISSSKIRAFARRMNNLRRESERMVAQANLALFLKHGTGDRWARVMEAAAWSLSPVVTSHNPIQRMCLFWALAGGQLAELPPKPVELREKFIASNTQRLKDRKASMRGMTMLRVGCTEEGCTDTTGALIGDPAVVKWVTDRNVVGSYTFPKGPTEQMELVKGEAPIFEYSVEVDGRTASQLTSALFLMSHGDEYDPSELTFLVKKMLLLRKRARCYFSQEDFGEEGGGLATGGIGREWGEDPIRLMEEDRVALIPGQLFETEVTAPAAQVLQRQADADSFARKWLTISGVADVGPGEGEDGILTVLSSMLNMDVDTYGDRLTHITGQRRSAPDQERCRMVMYGETHTDENHLLLDAIVPRNIAEGLARACNSLNHKKPDENADVKGKVKKSLRE